MAIRHYLDHNATSPLRPQARAAMTLALDQFGNPSSIHAEGRAARGLIEEARAQVASLVGASPANVVFTSGGTEAAALALTPDFIKAGQKADHLLLCATEHPCMLSGHRFPAEHTQSVKVRPDGRIDLDHLMALLAGLSGARPMLALQLANNETGVLQPVNEAAELIAQAGGITICDAVQAAGRIAVNWKALGVDALILSAHKFGGPKGAGALIYDTKTMDIGSKLIRGGGQEKGQRAGTENVTGLVGFGAAAQAALADLSVEPQRLLNLRQHCEQGLKELAPDLIVFGEVAPRLPNTLAFAIPGLTAETLLIALDLAGISISSGSACSSGKVQASHVLRAMGIAADLAKGALRISMGWSTTQADVEGLCAAMQKVLIKVSARRPIVAA